MDPGWDFVTAGGCQITGDDARIPLETQGTKLDVAAVAYDSIGGATNEGRPGLILPARGITGGTKEGLWGPTLKTTRGDPDVGTNDAWGGLALRL